MVSSSTCKWLGSVTLAGLLLVSSLPALATAQLKTASLPMKPMLVASTSTKVASDNYTQTLRKQMHWISSPVKTNISVESASTLVKSEVTPSKTVVVVHKPKKTAQPATSNPKPVQVAAVAPKPQVSRSSSSILLSNAESLKGIPYEYGGTSKSGFDCSGYTQYVFKGSGVSLPRTSSEQFNVGSSVKKDQLQTGDLVFFTTNQKGPSHVGIYVGSGEFIHASNSGVRTTSLNDGYYANRYLGARRI